MNSLKTHFSVLFLFYFSIIIFTHFFLFLYNLFHTFAVHSSRTLNPLISESLILQGCNRSLKPQ